MPKEPICTNVRAGLYQKYALASTSDGEPFVPPSGFGKQVGSANVNEPTVTFGTAPKSEKIKTKDTPSPVDYDSATTMFGKVKIVSGSIYRKSSPTPKFGTGQRGLPYKGNSILGPSYIPPSGFGKQTQSLHRSNSNSIIGKAERFPPIKTKDTPGPSAYPAAAVESFGKQTQSSRRNPPGFHFQIGRAERDKKEKGRGRDTPAPSYVPAGGLGKQTLSSKRTEAAVSIGTGKRFMKNRMKETPGPADFKPAESFGKQAVSIRKTAQSFSFGSR